MGVNSFLPLQEAFRELGLVEHRPAVYQWTDGFDGSPQALVSKRWASRYRNVQPGDKAAIRCTQGSILSYRIDTITDTNPKCGRVYIEQGDAWGGRAYYAKNGKSCMSPNGQVNLVVPTDEVITWIKENPGTVFTYDVDYDIIPPGQRDGSRRSLLPRTRDIVEEHLRKIK